MAQGTNRREATQDSLVGASEITPVLPQAPQLQVPNASVPDVMNTLSSQVANSLSKWSTSKFQAASDKEHEKSVLDGQMAYQQGVAMEDLEIPGDKFAMQGYRVMQAQTMASTMLAAQQQQIALGGYEQSPDEFRSNYVNRLEQQLDGLDSQTARMVREQMATHMPTLVAEHTQAYMKNEEQNAFNSLAASVDALSKDPTAADALLSNALGGEGTASAGLSQDRTRAAVVQGTVDAFSNNNPLAYTQMKSSGLLEDLPVAEKQILEQAKKEYENKLRTTYNEEHTANLNQYEADLADGKYDTPQAAVDALVSIYAKRGITVSASEAGAAYAGQKVAGDLGDRADVVVLQTAIVSGDHARVAELTQDIVMFHESGGDPDAVSPVGATGLMQVMPATSGDPGYGIKPSDGTQADIVRVGQEYWAAMVAGSEGKGSLNWKAGDIEAAAIAYNAGPENAKKWIDAGRDYSVLPKRAETEPYAKKIMASANGEDNYYTSAERLSLAETELTAAQKLKAAVEKKQAVVDKAKATQAIIEREDLFNQALVPINQQLQAGTITGDEYQTKARALLETYELDITRSISGSLIADVESSIVKAVARADKAATDADSVEDAAAKALKKDDIAKFQLEVAALGQIYQQSIATPGRDNASLEADQAAYIDFVTKAAADNGLVLAETKFGSLVTQSGNALARAKVASLKYNTEQILVDNAIATGTVDSLNPTLQTRAFKQLGSQNEELVSNAVTTGQLPNEQSGVALAQANTASWIQAGTVPSSVKAHASAIMSREFATNDVVNPQAIAVIQQWDAIRQDNPEVAATMFNESGLIKAQALLDLAGGSFASPDALSQAMIAEQRALDNANGLMTGQYIVDQTRITGDVNSAVDSFLASEDIGWLQGMWSGDSEMAQRYDRLQSDEQRVLAEDTREQLSGAILKESFRIQKLSPGQNAAFYAKQASQNVIGRTAVVGDQVVVMDKGFSIKEQMFGQHAGMMDKDGLEQEVILDGIRDMIASDDSLAWMGKATSREHDDFVLRAMWGVGDSIASIFGGSVNMPQISEEDAERVDRRGVRPFHISQLDGKRIGIQMRLPNGSLSGYLPLDLKTIGTNYRQKYLAKLAE